MKRYIVALLASVAFSASVCNAAVDGKRYSQAMALFQNGMYERARILFDESDPSGQDASAAGYSVLCSVILQSRGYEGQIEGYDARFRGSALSKQIHWRQGLHNFDGGRYRDAYIDFSELSASDLPVSEKSDYLYKRSYCLYMLDDMDAAVKGMEEVLSAGSANYSAPAHYTLGYIAYSRADFAAAEKHFAESGKDARYRDISLSYLLECRFMQKDYAYVVKNGEALYASAPSERKLHLARILSESYLVSGDASKAAEFLEMSMDRDSGAALSRNDYFFAGSVSYAGGDWQGAVKNFSLMPSRTDSLGQIANYQMAYSYIRLRNKVAALGAFRDASRYQYDMTIREDAYFNYAKLAFDLNSDSSIFGDYLRQYPDSDRGDQIYSYVALASLYNHDFASAVEAYDKIDELTPEMRSNYMKANYLRANQLILGGAWSDAIPCLKAASFFTDRRDAFNQLSRIWLAEGYFRTEKYDDARKLYTELYNLSALDGRPEGKVISYNLGYCYFMLGSYADAVKWFDVYAASSDKTYLRDALTRKADCYFAEKDYKSAVPAYQDAINVYSPVDDIYPVYQLGLSYGLIGKSSDKAKALETVSSADPSAPYYAEAMYELGRSYVALKKEALAISTFSNLASSAKDSEVSSKAYLELGMIYRNKRDNKSALEYYKKVVDMQKSGELYDDALYAIESIYQRMGDTDSYLAYLASLGHLSKSEQEKENLYYNAAVETFGSQNYAKAISSFQSYLEKYPQGEFKAESSFYLAESYRLTGNKEKALDFYNESLRLSDDGSIAESAVAQVALLSYSLERYSLAYDAYAQLYETARIAENKGIALTGMMRSAFKAKLFNDALAAAAKVSSDANVSVTLKREADYIQAKSLLATSKRDEAFAILSSLSMRPDTDEGAEACYLLIQDVYDRGDFKEVQDKVYDFADKSGDQSYWLAKAFIVLGDSFMELDNMPQAKATFESILDGYRSADSTDDVVDNVKMRLEKLKEL